MGKLAVVCATVVVMMSAATPALAVEVAPQAENDFPYDRFVAGTLANIEQEHAKDLLNARSIRVPRDKPIFVFDPRGLSYWVRVNWLGQSRPISEYRKRLITTYLFQHQIKDSENYYVREYLFEEGDKKYWLPMQLTLERNLAEEMQIGNKLDLYLLDIGSVIFSEKVDAVVIVEEFVAKP